MSLLLDRLRVGNPPEWASGWGHDRYGVFVEFTYADATPQRLRWIPPGRFLMGSPTGEAGQSFDEGPQHEVTINEGLWLFDTPCRQDLWEAVTGNNPSRFNDPLRPVEQVDVAMVEAFMERLQAEFDGLNVRLPTEAEWEFSCRAGTTSATYAGDLVIKGERNAPILDAIAWYGGNSGRDYDHAEAHNASEWKEKQYPDARAGTRRVGMKDPNPWGLFDMLGNVWEWCHDRRRAYETSPYINEVVSPPEGAPRFVRGGSWVSSARFVRSACRLPGVPTGRDYYLGFRCALVQPSGKRSGGAGRGTSRSTA